MDKILDDTRSRPASGLTKTAHSPWLQAWGLDVVAVMVDGVHFAGHCCVVALGITIDGTKVPLGVVEGDTENATVVKDLLADLRDRGLDVTRPTLVVIDGAKALAAAVHAVFDHPVVQRCQLHKIRNVEAKLPKALAATVTKKMRAAYHDPDPLTAEATLEALARGLDRSHPGAAGSLREGSRRDAHHQPARRATHPGPDAAVHQRDRVDDRDLPRPQHQREALAGRPHGAALVRRRHGRSRQAVPTGQRPPPPPRPPPSPRRSRRRNCHTRHARMRTKQPEHHRAATQVPRNSGHPRSHGNARSAVVMRTPLPLDQGTTVTLILAHDQLPRK